MHEKLETSGRLPWVQEEMADLEDPAKYDTDPAKAWQRLKLRTQKKDYAALIVAVAAWREQLAQDLDKPRRRILKDDAIQEIASQKPRSENDYNQLRAVPNGFIRSKHGQGLMDAVQAAMDSPDQFECPDPGRCAGIAESAAQACFGRQ